MEDRAKPFRDLGGIRFHLSLILYGPGCLRPPSSSKRRGYRFGHHHYFALAFFRTLEIPVVVNLRNFPWPRGNRPVVIYVRFPGRSFGVFDDRPNRVAKRSQFYSPIAGTTLAAFTYALVLLGMLGGSSSPSEERVPGPPPISPRAALF